MPYITLEEYEARQEALREEYQEGLAEKHYSREFLDYFRKNPRASYGQLSEALERIEKKTATFNTFFEYSPKILEYKKRKNPLPVQFS